MFERYIEDADLQAAPYANSLVSLESSRFLGRFAKCANTSSLATPIGAVDARILLSGVIGL